MLVVWREAIRRDVKEYGSKQRGLLGSSGGAAAQISFAAPHLFCTSLEHNDPKPDSFTHQPSRIPDLTEPPITEDRQRNVVRFVCPEPTCAETGSDTVEAADQMADL
jgi:hypothetical protein